MADPRDGDQPSILPPSDRPVVYNAGDDPMPREFIDPPIPARPPGGYDPETGSPLLTYREHLVELRDRLIKSVAALLITTVVSFLFTETIFELLKSRAEGVRLIRTGVAEMVTTYVKVAFISGVVLATPVWLYQVVAFVAPGLTKNERRFLYAALPGVLASFGIGVAFGYFVMLPPALQFLIHFGEDIADPLIRVGDYVGVVVGLLFWLGVVFETPLIIYLLARLGIVTPQLLTRFRRHAIVVAFVIAAVITPTVDPVNQAIVAVPIIILYELGILLSRLAVRARAGH